MWTLIIGDLCQLKCIKRKDKSYQHLLAQLRMYLLLSIYLSQTIKLPSLHSWLLIWNSWLIFRWVPFWWSIKSCIENLKGKKSYHITAVNVHQLCQCFSTHRMPHQERLHWEKSSIAAHDVSENRSRLVWIYDDKTLDVLLIITVTGLRVTEPFPSASL